MAFLEKKPRKWGDRRDGLWVRDLPGLNAVIAFLWPRRTECEAYLQQTIDVTELLHFIEKKNAEHPEYKTTLFHCVVTAIFRMLNERPKMNRFVQGGRTYERDEITAGFVAKRKFTDHSEESLMLLTAQAEDTIDTVSKKIIGDVKEARERKETAGIDNILDILGAFPRPFLWAFIRFIRTLDYWGKVPRALTDGDMNYASVSITNLGSIKCPSVYHHLGNYGTTSVFVSIGTIHKEQLVMEDGSLQIRDVVDLGVTVDERIADGFYFARSWKLVKHICAHPELLDKPLCEESGYEYQ